MKGNIKTGAIYIVIIMLALGIMGSQLTQGLIPSNQANNTGQIVTPVIENADTDPGKKNLQLYTFGFITPAPKTPQINPPVENTCQSQIKPPSCQACTHGASMICPDVEGICTPSGGFFNPLGWYEPQYTCAYLKDTNESKFNEKKNDANCVEACIAKPVIYLYPLVSTLVDVIVKVPGNIFISDPLYPEGGWKNVLAHPDGTLIYKNKKYSELFFESDVDKVNPPDQGLVFATKDLEKSLSEAITRLGLIGREKAEFLEFWIPVLRDLNSPYIQFSILDKAEKDRVDRIEISPKPDTFIAFIAYFKPLDNPKTDLKPLILPDSPPQRIGFTAVEWGGTIAD